MLLKGFHSVHNLPKKKCYVSRTLRGTRKLTSIGNKWFYSNLSKWWAAKKPFPFMPIIKKTHCCLACRQNTPVFVRTKKNLFQPAQKSIRCFLFYFQKLVPVCITLSHSSWRFPGTDWKCNNRLKRRYHPKEEQSNM